MIDNKLLDKESVPEKCPSEKEDYDIIYIDNTYKFLFENNERLVLEFNSFKNTITELDHIEIFFMLHRFVNYFKDNNIDYEIVIENDIAFKIFVNLKVNVTDIIDNLKSLVENIN